MRYGGSPAPNAAAAAAEREAAAQAAAAAAAAGFPPPGFPSTSEDLHAWSIYRYENTLSRKKKSHLIIFIIFQTKPEL